MPKFDYDAIKTPAPAFKEATRTTPDRMSNILILLVFSTGVLILWLIIFAMIYSRHQYVQLAGYFSMGTVTLMIIWIAVDRKAIQTIEVITGHDLDGDGYMGEPPVPGEYKITIEEGPTQTRYLPMQSEAEREKMWRVARMICNGTPFSEGALTGTNRPLSRSEFLNFRDMLMGRGYLAWKDKRHKTLGCEFTVKGMSVMHELASTTPPRMRTQGAQNVLPPGPVGEWEEEDNALD